MVRGAGCQGVRQVIPSLAHASGQCDIGPKRERGMVNYLLPLAQLVPRPVHSGRAHGTLQQFDNLYAATQLIPAEKGLTPE